jgi:hypothetical protein
MFLKPNRDLKYRVCKLPNAPSPLAHPGKSFLLPLSLYQISPVKPYAVHTSPSTQAYSLVVEMCLSINKTLLQITFGLYYLHELPCLAFCKPRLLIG